MKILNGTELVSYIKVRQAKQVRALRQAHKVFPRLAIIQTTDHPVIDTYVGLKRRYGDDILIDVDIHKVAQADVPGLLETLNRNETVHGIIIQLPLADPAETDTLLNMVAPDKDVDGLGDKALFDPATPMAINWLLNGYNVTLSGRKIVIIGRGRLVGAPLTRMWRNSGYDVTAIDRSTPELESKQLLKDADIIVTASGVPGILTTDLVSPDTVVVDAGTATDNGKVVGDVAPEVRERHDLTITPEKGGVGPLTVCALFDNVIRAAQQRTTS